MNKYQCFILIVFSFLLFSQCTVKTTEKLTNHQGEKFDVFLEKFLTDSIFQISRINFPVKGLPVSVTKDIFENGYYWTVDDWDIHIKYDYKAEGYERILQNKNGIIREQLVHSQGWFVERRFKKSNGKWFLIYYSAPNATSIMKAFE